MTDFDKFVGVPYPGAKGGFELRSKVRLPTEYAEFTTAANHSEECRSRIAAELEKVGDARLGRETKRLFEFLEEEEKRKTGASEDKKTGVSEHGASSSGPAPAQERVPRSRGAVPMATESEIHGEAHKRKAGDVAEEDMKDKKNKTGKEEERGAKRSVNEWEEYAKRFKDQCR